MRFATGQIVKITAGGYKDYIGLVGSIDFSGEEVEYNITVQFEDSPDVELKLQASEMQPLSLL